jgi:hypothetical protein
VPNGVNFFLLKTSSCCGYLRDYALAMVAAMQRKLLQKAVVAWLVKSCPHFMETQGSLR